MPVVINGTTGITNVNGSAAAPAETGTDTDTGIYYGTNTVGLATNGTNALFVDASQNVGVGTTSPGVKLDVNGALRVGLASNPTTIANNSQFYDQSGIGPTISGYNFQVRTGNPTPTASLFVDSANNVGIGTSSPGLRLDVAGGDGSTFDQSISGGRSSNYAGSLLFKNSYWNSGAYGAAAIRGLDSGTSGGLLAFYTTTNGSGTTGVPTERARIDSSGNLLVGTTGAVLSTNTFFKAAGASNPAIVAFKNSSSSSTDQAFCVANGLSGGTVSFQVLASGNAQNTNNSYGAISDVNLKENIVDATPKLSDLMRVQVRHYNLKSDETKAKQIGVIAQELEEVFPGMIETDAEGMKGVKYSVFVPMLIKAIQELKAQNDDLRARVAALEGAA